MSTLATETWYCAYSSFFFCFGKSHGKPRVATTERRAGAESRVTEMGLPKCGPATELEPHRADLKAVDPKSE